VLRAHPLALGSVTHTFPSGLSMAGLPESPDESDAAEILGLAPAQTLLLRWSATLPGGNRYIFYPDTPPFEPGLGYWLNLGAPRAVTAHGLLPSGEWRIHLRQGWHQICNPFPTAVALTGVTVKSGDAAPVTVAQARATGIISAFSRYSGGTYVTATSLPSYEGVWVCVFAAQGCWLIVQEP